MGVPREWRFPGKSLPRSDFFNSLLVAVVFGVGDSRLAHLCTGEQKRLDLPLDRLVERFDQPDAKFIPALPDDRPNIIQTGLLDLHSQPACHHTAGVQAKPRAILVQIADDSIYDFVPRAVRDATAQNAPFPLCGATISSGLRGS